MSIFWLEVRRSVFAFAAPLIFITGAVFAISSTYPLLASWANTTVVLLAADSFLAPVIVGVAAWSALRSRRRKLDATEGTALRSRANIRVVQMVADALWVLLWSMLMLIAVIVRGVIVGLTGNPEFVSLTYGVILPVLFVAVGYATVALIDHWVAIPIAICVPLALFAANNFGTGAVSQLALNPLYRFTNWDPYTPDAVFYLGQTLVLVGYLAVVVVAMSLVWRAKSWLAITLVLIMCIPAFAVGSAALAARGANGVLAEPSPLVLTDKQTGLTIQVLDLYKPVADELLSTWSRISRLSEGTELSFSTLAQDIEPTYSEHPEGRFYRLDLNPSSHDIAAASVDMAFNDVTTCQDGGAGGGDWWLEGQIVVRTWLQGKSEFPSSVFVTDPDMQRALVALEQLDDEAATDWFGEHAANLLDCDWSKTDFPLR